MRELDTGTFIDCNLTTLGDYLNNWLEVCCKPNQTQNTYESYERNVKKHIIPGIRNIKLISLTPLQLQGFFTKCLKEGRLNNKGGLSGKTVLYLHRILHSALGQAVKWQLIIRNVGDLVDPPKPKKFKPKVFESNQVKQLIAVAEVSDIHIPVLLGIFTGMRRGEVLGLMWKDVDLKNGVLRVTQSLAATKDGLQYLPPKSDSSNRNISLPLSIIPTLKKHRTQQAQMKLRLGDGYQDKDLVCCYPDGRPLHPGTFSHQFSDLLGKNKLPLIRFHDLSYPNLNKIQTISKKA